MAQSRPTTAADPDGHPAQYIAEHGAERYHSQYQRGWKTSATTGNLDRADADGRTSDDAWMDGYLDHATGRAKWHRLSCAAHHNAQGGCGEA